MARKARFAVALAAVAAMCGAAMAGATAGAAEAPTAAPYAPAPASLSTPWTGSVSSVSPWPEYPRPQLERTSWQNLNGRWQYERGALGQRPPFKRTLAQTILVPFPVESPLSGIAREDIRGWYRRTFTIPRSWHGKHVILNFGAVAWQARVYVNGRRAGIHEGDFDSFSLDITRLLRPRGQNELVVGFFDPLGAAGEPVGKQAPGAPRGYLHTAVSGIWQTVWLEPVPATHIDGLQLTPELGRSELIVSPAVAGPGAPSAGPGAPSAPRGITVRATAFAGPRRVSTASAGAGRELVLHIPRPIAWSPWRPYLYGLRVELIEKGRVRDSVGSYFGMRSISLGRAGGATRILLDGRFVFESGALDQGYWPDGLYTPPTDDAIRFDIQAAKRLGFDMLREHEKVEPDRWYYWADRLGILVWQDMPSLSLPLHRPATPATEREFRRELGRIVVQHRSDPSVVVWVPFNEGWGAFDPAGITRQIKRLDPGALIDVDSGSANCCAVAESPAGDIRDAHLYSGPFAVAADRRASVIGEYGGVLPYPPAAHRWPGLLTSVGVPVLAWPAPPAEDLLRAQFAALSEEMRVRGLSAAVFTELANYEQELGILTYDREVVTMSSTLWAGLNRSLIDASEHPAQLEPQAAALPPGADGIWSFSEGHGSRAADSSSQADALTLEGGVGWGHGPRLRGRATGALRITGPGQAAIAARALIDSTRSFTVSAWLAPAALGETGTAVSEPGPDGSSFSLGIETGPRRPRGTATHWTLIVPAGSNCTSAQCGVRANMRYDDGRDPPLAGRWYMVTGVYDAATASIALYVDGVPEDFEHVFGVPPAEGPLTVGEGNGDYTPVDCFRGRISGLRTWSRALSPAEVWQLYRYLTG